MSRIRNRLWSWTGFVQRPDDGHSIKIRGEVDYPPDPAGDRRYPHEYEDVDMMVELWDQLNKLVHRKVRVTIEEME